MSIELVQQKLLTYQSQTVLEQDNALKEIAQEIALLALSRAGFFKVAAFQGGTCLRIMYGLARFSEDLDFVLEKANKQFSWQPYIQSMSEEFNAYGYALTVTDKSKLDKPIRSAFLKANSLGGLLILKDLRTNRAALQIKLEIDVNPPEGSTYERRYLDFPLPFSVQTQDLPSLFASKSHALLCREYVKGRDWFDFIWYVSNKVLVNFTLLTHAIEQKGPWENKQVTVTKAWYLKNLREKIKNIDWDEAKKDVARFLRPRELATLDLWSKEFFLSRVEILANYLPE